MHDRINLTAWLHKSVKQELECLTAIENQVKKSSR